MTLFDHSAQQLLSRGLTEMGISCDAAQQAQLLAYAALLLRWNKAYNLTAITDPGEVVVKHLLDSLSLYPYLSRTRYIDVGTGAGLPGIPLAIAAPDKQFTLLDSNGKKTRFLTQAKMELALNNVEVVNARVESWVPTEPFQGVICRAFAALSEFLAETQHLALPEGEFLAMKGAWVAEENDVINNECGVQIIPLTIPGLDAKRHLVIIKKESYAKSHCDQ